MSQNTTVVALKGTGDDEDALLKCARLTDGLSEIPELLVEMAAMSETLDLSTLVGKPMKLELTKSDDAKAEFKGTCVSARYLGIRHGTAHYGLEIRPWLWFLTRRTETRIFQDKKVIDIIKDVLGDYGFSSNLSDKTTKSFHSRVYCVQYRETDFAFLSRLMEQEGIYYYFDYSASTEKLVLCDGSGAHSAVPGFAKIEYMPKDEQVEFREDQISEWYGGLHHTPGEVTIDDYDFEAPKSDLSAVSKKPKGSWSHKDLENYDYVARYPDASTGTHYARVRMESIAIRHKIWHGVGNVRGLSVGQTFTLEKHPRSAENQEYLVTRATHFFVNETAFADLSDIGAIQEELLYGDDDGDAESYLCVIEAAPKSEPYRAPQVTPWPRVSGVHTALVVGKSGEEVWTDKYGRIRVQFHWDREGKKNDKSTCWVRVGTPWTGPNWGMIHIPRMGQEVIVDFVEGDPDQPLVTGCVWNADNMPPYPLPANATIQGIKTNKSKGGGGFHELIFEDKAGKEYIRMQSERDYQQVVKNNASIEIGTGHKNRGDLDQFINRNKTETVKEVRTHLVGLIEDLTAGVLYDETVGMVKTQTVGVYKEEKIGFGKQDFTTPSGILSTAITLGGPLSAMAGGAYADFGAAATAVSGLNSAKNHPGKKEEIHGTSTLEVFGDRKVTIAKSTYKGPAKEGHFTTKVDDGDVKLDIKKGKYTTTVDKGNTQLDVKGGNYVVNVNKGNQTNTVKMGNATMKASKGSITIQAMQKITLKVGSNKIEISMSGIKMKGVMIDAKGTAQVKLDAPMIQMKAKGMLKAEGPMVQIQGKAMGMFKAPMVQIDGSALAMVKGGIAMIN
ncbi:MAG: type VI secretion system tip protein TssI/VgrG [Pseudomonadota bacterium]